MKKITTLFLLLSLTAFCQNENYNTKKEFVAEGYDVVSYFKNKVAEGTRKFISKFDF